MATTADLIVQSWTHLATDTVAKWAKQTKELVAATDPASQAKAVQDAGGLVVSGAVCTWATLMEVLALLAEPVEVKQLAHSKPHLTKVTLATDPYHLRVGDLVHAKDSTKVIPAAEVTVRGYDSATVIRQPALANTLDPHLWVRVSTWINGRRPGQYLGTVTVLDGSGAVREAVPVTLVI